MRRAIEDTHIGITRLEVLGQFLIHRDALCQIIEDSFNAASIALI